MFPKLYIIDLSCTQLEFKHNTTYDLPIVCKLIGLKLFRSSERQIDVPL
jgi:hypothetical protein